MTTKEYLTWSVNYLKKAKIEQPESSASFLLCRVLSVDRAHLLVHPEQTLTMRQGNKFKKWVERRAKHEPVWYITGKIEFYSNYFSVNNSVLVPRPETEILVEKVIQKYRNTKYSDRKVLDIGTGSGAIILSLAKNLNGSFYASDISAKALVVAKKNRKNLGLEGVVTMKKGDLFAPWIGQKFDVIVANLPYVPHEDMASLALDLIHYEPRTALDGGEKGLEVYRRFFVELPSFLNKKALVYCEIGINQGVFVKAVIKEALPGAKVTIWRDYSSVDRIAIIET